VGACGTESTSGEKGRGGVSGAGLKAWLSGGVVGGKGGSTKVPGAQHASREAGGADGSSGGGAGGGDVDTAANTAGSSHALWRLSCCWSWWVVVAVAVVLVPGDGRPGIGRKSSGLVGADVVEAARMRGEAGLREKGEEPNGGLRGLLSSEALEKMKAVSVRLRW